LVEPLTRQDRGFFLRLAVESCFVVSGKPMTAMATFPQQRRARGRPKLGDVRFNVIVPKDAWAAILRQEKESGTYRTRIAANIICTWATKEAGWKITPYH
jgi:hypothetical protein